VKWKSCALCPYPAPLRLSMYHWQPCVPSCPNALWPFARTFITLHLHCPCPSDNSFDPVGIPMHSISVESHRDLITGKKIPDASIQTILLQVSLKIDCCWVWSNLICLNWCIRTIRGRCSVLVILRCFFLWLSPYASHRDEVDMGAETGTETGWYFVPYDLLLWNHSFHDPTHHWYRDLSNVWTLLSICLSSLTPWYMYNMW
jgi:hypothetical protein